MVLTIPLRWLAAGCATTLLLAAALLGLSAGPAQAATLQQVTSFGSNPGALAMYSYRPDGLLTGAPAVVLLHGCTQDATTFLTSSGWRKYADLHGFALVLAQQSTTNHSNTCFTSSNYAHVAAGRAYQSGGYAYATGSNQLLGLNNTYYTATLKQSSPGYWEKC